MPDMIRDGTGGGYLAQVTSENKLRTYCTTESESSYESEVNKRCYTWTTAYNVSAADTVIWLRNDSTTLNLVLEKVLLANDTATRFTVHFPANATPAGTEVTGVNLNRGSNNLAEATCYSDETNNTQANSFANGILQANVPAILPIDGTVVLGYKDCIGIDFVTGSSSIGMATIRAYYHEVS